MPGAYILFKDSTKVINWLDVVKGLVASGTATSSQTYANADVYPNAQNWTIEWISGGNLFVGQSIATPTATANSAILGSGGQTALTKEAFQNSLSLLAINFGCSANNTAFSLSWDYT